jgi:hypothetical protein
MATGKFEMNEAVAVEGGFDAIKHIQEFNNSPPTRMPNNFLYFVCSLLRLAFPTLSHSSLLDRLSSSLPQTIISFIFSLLSIYDHADLSQVSKLMNQISALPSSSYVLQLSSLLVVADNVQ